MGRMGPVFLILLLVMPAARAQQAPVSIRGRVVVAENDLALRRALITPTRGDRRKPVLTDDDGRFEITVADLSPSLIVSKAGYASASMRDKWFTGSRHVKRGLSGPNGPFEINGLSPGEYWVAAFDGIGSDDWYTSDFLDSLVSRATRLTVGEGQVYTTALRLIRRSLDTTGMRHPFIRVAGFFLVLTTSSVALAQQPPVSIRGRVVAAENDVPLRRARIALESRDPRILAVLTDEEGHFSITVPDAGQSKLVVTKGGYAAAAIDVPRVESATAPARELEIRLIRGAAVSGQVLDRSGAPATGAEVVVSRLDVGSGDANFPTRFEAETDDLGEYRTFGLPAGRYSVTAGRAAPGTFSTLREGSVSRTVTLPGAPPRASEPPGPAQTVEIRRGDEQGDINFVVEVPLQTSMFAITPDGSSRPQGRGVIRGQMLPSSGERITQMPVTLRGTGFMMTNITDGSGRFVFDGLPAGDYTLSGPGDVTAQYAQQRDIRVGEVIRVRDDPSANPNVLETRDPAVTGTLVDEFGEPFQGVMVQALELRYASGQRVATRVGVGRRTDDRGRYRVSGLPPGSYYLVTSTDASASESDSERSHGYPPVYYPGTPSIDAAQAVQVDAGRDALGVDLTLALSVGARLSGVALAEDGTPLAGSVRLTVSQRSRAIALEPRGAPIGANGAFEFSSLPPGDYVVQAHGEGRFGSPPAFGAVYVSVADRDPPPLTIRTSPGATLEGRIVIEGAQEPTIFGFSLVPLQADVDLGPGRDLRTSGPVISSNGTFYQARLYGPTRFALTTAPENWYLKSVTVGGADITDGFFDFGSGAATFEGAEVVLSRAGATVSGTVSDEKGVSGRRYSVAVFAMDRNKRFAGSGHLKYARALPDGSFQVHGLPPGDFWVAAVDGTLGLGDWQNPETLESLAPRATRLTIGESETVTTTLRPIRRP